MPAFLQTNTFQAVSGVVIGCVWVFHGLYSKMLGGIPRHRLIVGRILGERFARRATIAIGLLEVLLGVWAFSGQQRFACALVQTLAITGMVLLNLLFLALIWHWALFIPTS